MALKRGDGSWYTEEEQLKTMAVDFYKDLYTEEGGEWEYPEVGGFPSLNYEDIQGLLTLVTACLRGQMGS